MRRSWVALTCAVLVAACGSATSAPTTSPPLPTQPAVVPIGRVETSVVRSDNAFAAALLGQLWSQQGNLIVSPYSIATALQMALQGARGQTATEMLRVLHLTDPATAATALATLNRSFAAVNVKDGPTLRISDALWLQHGMTLEPTFLSTLQKAYAAALHDVDFVADPDKARRAINDEVARQTNDRIRDLIPSGVIDTMTRLVLTNAIYLTALWGAPFDKSMTKPATFHLGSGTGVAVPFMHESEIFSYAKQPGCQELRLPFLGDRLEMTLYLPDGSVDTMVRQLRADGLARRLPPNARAKVDLALPKFRFTSTFTLNPMLSAMGMPTAFDATKADFSGITQQEPLYIKAVLHKAFVNVDENGTEAAAATAVITEGTAAEVVPQHVRLTFDRPFVFTIDDQTTGAVLFAGRVTDPRS